MLSYGVRTNLGQVLLLLLQVLLVGMTLGMMRTVVPALAETEFGVPRSSFMLLVAFVVAFGFVKGAMNFIAGRLAEQLGRKRVLLMGWLVALPIPVIIYFANTWAWIVFATVLMGVNQGLTWSMTQSAKLDITRADQRGMIIGLNEFSGYVGVALAGIATAYVTSFVGVRTGLLWFGGAVVVLGATLTWLLVVETLSWAQSDAKNPVSYSSNLGIQPSTGEVFALMSWRDKRMAALCQAGLVEKFVDALVWVFWPIYLHQQGVSLQTMAWIVGVYGFSWGGAQLMTGKLSDRVGRHRLNYLGMWVCGAGVGLMPLGTGVEWWSTAAAITGLGMAMCYPNLSAAVADLAHASWRASAIGIYRFWRDIGYGVGAFGLAVAAGWGGQIESAFWFVSMAMLVSGAVLLVWGEETHPKTL